MHGDLNINRFILMVLIFILSIIFLIIRPNIIGILLGLDGLGYVYYCLEIYYQNVKSYGARGSVVVKALFYKPEDRGFDSR
jgi:NADH-ubiquinone oxidoreductase chain 5